MLADSQVWFAKSLEVGCFIQLIDIGEAISNGKAMCMDYSERGTMSNSES